MSVERVMNAMIRVISTFTVILMLGLANSSSFAGESLPLTQGQTIYVSAYSDVFHGDQVFWGKADKWPFAVMLSIHNTDPKDGMTVRSVRYYDTHGKLIREHQSQAKNMGPMETMEYFVDNKDSIGGTGANFLVVWDSGKPINAPIIETVQTGFVGIRSAIFISQGQQIHVETDSP